MHLRRVDHDEDHADHRGEQQVHGDGDELLDVGADLLQLAQRLAAALVLELRVGQFERVADAVGVDPRADLLGDQVDVVVLKVLGDAGDEGHADRRAQQERYAANELPDRVVVEARGVGIDDVAEDQRIEQREDLVDGRQHERGGNQLPVVPQIAVKSGHLFTLTTCN